jgi:hypothetical protein
VKNGIARQPQLAQDFSCGPHYFRQALRADDDQRDRKDENYFKKVQTSMTVARDCMRNSMTRWDAEKFRSASFPRQLITIPDSGANYA